MKHLKWPNKRVDSGQAWGVISAGLVIAAAIVGALAPSRISKPNYAWAWPTNYMAIPAAIVLVGLVLLVVPVRRVELRLPTPLDPGSGAYCIPLVSAELEQWQQFIAAAAEKGWIKFADEMPTADALNADDGSPRQVIPEPLKANLLKVYRYFTAVIAAHEGIESWRKSEQTKAPAMHKGENGGVADALASAISAVIVTVGIHGGRYAWLIAKLMRTQEKNREYQTRLQALPGILAKLRKDVEAIGAGASTNSTAQATPVEVPDVPVIETGNDGSIDFQLTPIKGYTIDGL